MRAEGEGTELQVLRAEGEGLELHVPKVGVEEAEEAELRVSKVGAELQVSKVGREGQELQVSKVGAVLRVSKVEVAVVVRLHPSKVGEAAAGSKVAILSLL